MTPVEVLYAVLGRGLESRLDLPTEPLAPQAWAELASHTDGAHLWGDVADAVATGDLPATNEQAEQASAQHEQAMGTVLELEILALDVLDLLAQSGLDARLLKGMATAHLDHPDPNRRTFSDIDLLVEPGRFTATLDALAAHGWRRDLPERRPDFDDRFGKDGTLQRDHWGQVDLHRTLVMGAFGLWIDLDDLWSGSAAFVLGGREVHALDSPRRLLHSCYAAVLSDPQPRLALLRDIALLAHQAPDRIQEARELARGWHGESVLAEGLALTAQRLGLSGVPRVDPATLQERLALRSYRSHGGTNTALRLAGVLGVRGVTPRLAYLYALALPSPGYRVARRDAGRPSEWRRGARELGRLARRT